MTRDYAIEHCEEYVEVEKSGARDLVRFINKIYDCFENRTCESCKFFELDRFEEGRGTCRCKNVPVRNLMVDNDYCCNRYEKRK